MTKWQFRTLNPNDTSGTSTAEDNFAQEERTSIDILVRECIQNPLDARLETGNIKVHFKWRTLDTKKSKFASDLLTEEFRRQQISAGIGEISDIPATIDVLVIEDFGTIGLRGCYDDSAVEGDEQNWNAFWFREGEGAKPSKANGGAGQGKLTMYVASRIRTVAALTTRETDGKRLLFGSCRFRRNYIIDKNRYAREARWGSTSDANELAMPIQDDVILDKYEKELEIQRGKNSGTTFLIPMPDQAIKPEAITAAVINEFYFPILRGTLTVYVEGKEISSTTITELAAQFSKGLRIAAPYRLFLDSIVKNHLVGQSLITFDKHWGNESKLSPEHLVAGQIQTVRHAFQNGEIISALFPIRVSSVSDGPKQGLLRVFLQEAEPEKIHELFIRQDLAVDKEKSLRTTKRLAPARALILIDDEILSRFLAAAEEPTHREWNGSRPKLALQFRNAAVTLKLVRNAASRLLELLVPPATKDTLALASFFPDVKAQKEPEKLKLPKAEGLPGDDGSPKIPPPKQRKLELLALDDGALVRVNSTMTSQCVFPLICKLELAYATELGRPFDQWDSADFYLTEKSHLIKFIDVQDIIPRGNEISFQIFGPEGSISISGFDKNRQLEMRLKYIEDSDANNLCWTNNPTKVQTVGKETISIRVTKVPGSDVARTFFIEHFERDQIKLPFATKVACVATAGQTAQYFELGTLDHIDVKAHALTELATDASIRFRVIFYEGDSSKILATADNINTVDDDTSSPSLVSIQPVSLDGPLWKLELADSGSDTHPVLLVEEKLFSSAKAAAASPTFVSFVLPEVVRAIANKIYIDNIDGEDENSWLAPWIGFFKSINSGIIDPSFSDSEDCEKWIDDCVKAFCRRGQMALSIDALLNEMDGAN